MKQQLGEVLQEDAELKQRLEGVLQENANLKQRLEGVLQENANLKQHEKDSPIGPDSEDLSDSDVTSEDRFGAFYQFED